MIFNNLLFVRMDHDVNSKMFDKSACFVADNLRYQKLILLISVKHTRSTAFIEKSA